MNDEQLKERLEFLNQAIEEDRRAIRDLSHMLEKMVKERARIHTYFEAEAERESQKAE